jgi:prepilin-type processing-associated H-X9-DG protein
MSRVVRYVLIGLMLLLLAGVAIPVVSHWRDRSAGVGCEFHLMQIGLIGSRHATTPNGPPPTESAIAFPVATWPNEALPFDRRLSWYASMLSVFEQGSPDPAIQKRQRKIRGLNEALAAIELNRAWNDGNNDTLSRFRLSVALCPAQAADLDLTGVIPNSYIANGGVGIKPGAYRLDGETPLVTITDGQRETAQFVETARDLGPWLQGGASTWRVLDPLVAIPIGSGRPFGGCHREGVNMSMCDGSVRFVKESIHPQVFRALFSIAGGETFEDLEVP